MDVVIQMKQSEQVDVFLAYGAKFCPSSLQAAVDGGNEDMVKRIIASGVDVNEGDTT